MNVVIISDEVLITQEVSSIIKNNTHYKTVATFFDSKIALKNIIELNVDAIILETKIKRKSGIEIAKKLQSKFSNLQIIFLSNTGKFAIEAFDIGAIHYLLKPINKSKLINALNRAARQTKQSKVFLNLHSAEDSMTQKNYLSTFGHLKFLKKENNDFQNIPVKWRTKISKELFAYLLTNHNKIVSKSVLTDLFWESFDPPRAAKQLYTSIYHIRNLLKKINFPIKIESESYGYRLDLNGVISYKELWEVNIRSLDAIDEHNVLRMHQLVAEYDSGFLNDSDYIWADTERERLKTIWLQLIERIAHYYITNDMYENAIAFYLSTIKADPLVEEFYFNLMKLYNVTDNNQAVIAKYNDLCQMLDENFAITPDKQIAAWFNNWKENNIILDKNNKIS